MLRPIPIRLSWRVLLMHIRAGQSKMPGTERCIYRGDDLKDWVVLEFESALIVSDLLNELPGCVSAENLSDSLA